MSVLLLRADAGRIPLADGTVHCVVTSPPYMGLRRYDSLSQVREWADGSRVALGNESRVEDYVAHIVECFAEVRRVLRNDGVAWVVLGDSYGRGKRPAWEGDARRGVNRRKAWVGYAEGAVGDDAPGQDGQLLMVPWRVALALQASGWIVRNDVVFAKRACMPESLAGWAWSRCRVKVASKDMDAVAPQKSDVAAATPQKGLAGHSGGAGVYIPAATWADCPGCDRCAPNGGLVLRRSSWRNTRSHEVVLQLVKSMHYFADAEAVAEPARHAGRVVSYNGTQKNTDHENRTYPGAIPRDIEVGATRNPRSWVLVGPEPLAAPHYASFPTALIEPFIRATCPERVCAKCGAAWARIVERGDLVPPASRPDAAQCTGNGETTRAQLGAAKACFSRASRTLGHRPTCTCDAGKPVPGIVLDPFVGAGTTMRVAVKLGRHGIGCDLSRSYLTDIADHRTRGVQVEMPGGAP